MESTYQPSFKEKLVAALFIWKMNLSSLVVLTLVFLLVAWIPLANIGFIAGYIRAILKVARGEGPAQVSDLFNAWDCFGNLLVYVIVLIIAGAVLSIIPLLGQLAIMALSFVAMPGLYAIVDGKFNAADAAKWSLAAIQANPVEWLLAFIVGHLLTMVGMILLGIGIILTMPLGSLLQVQQYESAKPA